MQGERSTAPQLSVNDSYGGQFAQASPWIEYRPQRWHFSRTRTSRRPSAELRGGAGQHSASADDDAGLYLDADASHPEQQALGGNDG